MKCVIGIDLGSTTTKAVLLDESGEIARARGSPTAAATTRWRAPSRARRRSPRRASTLLERALRDATPEAQRVLAALARGVPPRAVPARARRAAQRRSLARPRGDSAARRRARARDRPSSAVLDDDRADAAAALFASDGAPRRATSSATSPARAFVAEAEALARTGEVPFEPLVGLFDRAILEVETRVEPRDDAGPARRAWRASRDAGRRRRSRAASARSSSRDRGADRARSPSSAPATAGRRSRSRRSAVRSEILCHGRGAHRVFPGTRTVLDIGGQDTKAIQVDERGVVTVVPDERPLRRRAAAATSATSPTSSNLGLHELGPLALQARRRCVKVNSTCTVFAGAELRERLALGAAARGHPRRAPPRDHAARDVAPRALGRRERPSSRSPAASATTRWPRRCCASSSTRTTATDITLNIHPDSIYMGALGAALFALDDVRAGRASATLPAFVRDARRRRRAP